jgi:hypothetical protein
MISLFSLCSLPFNSYRQRVFAQSQNQSQNKEYITLSTGIDELKEQFNKDQGKTRLLMVLSPG